MRMKICSFMFFFLCFSVSHSLSADHRRDVVRIAASDEATAALILSLGLDVISAKPGVYFEALLQPEEVDRLRESGLSITVVRENLGKVLAERNRAGGGSSMRFGEGSMGGYYTYDETIGILDSLIANDPHGIIAGLDTIGISHRGRPIVLFTVSDNPEDDEGEPEVLYDALHHAREPMGLMNLLYFLERLIEEYGNSPQITYLVDNRKLWFIPILNPDGYAVNESIYINTSEFGFWRKNVRDNNSNGVFDDWYDGVDLNRNYGYEWGYDDYGSSPEPGSAVYRGPAAFSEPETWAIKDLCESRSFELALNYHSYGDLLIFPWGYSDAETADSLVFREIADHMTELNNYQFGTGSQTVYYVTNGDADDWMYGEQITKGRIISMTPEIGDTNDWSYFWPPQEAILPLAQENLYPNIFLALAAGYHVVQSGAPLIDDGTGDGDGYPDEGETVDITVTLKNVGVSQTATGLTAELSTISPSVTITKETAVFDDADVGREVDNSLDVFTIRIADTILPGEIAKFHLAISGEGGYVNTDSFDLILGTPQVIFYDGAEEGLVNFTSDNWDVVSQKASEGVFSFTDSPFGNYPSNANEIMTCQVELDLSDAENAYLTYDARWEIEKGYDIGKIEVSRNGSDWTAMEATGTFAGSGYNSFQNPEEEGYQSRQIVFTPERVNLSEFLGEGGETVTFRFVLQSDYGLEFDGWYIDEIKVLSYGGGSGLDDTGTNRKIPSAFGLGQNYPNPFNPSTSISFEVPGDSSMKNHTRLLIYDLRGRLIRTLVEEPLEPGHHLVSWNGRNDAGETVGSGLYIYRFESAGKTATRKMVLLK